MRNTQWLLECTKLGTIQVPVSQEYQRLSNLCAPQRFDVKTVVFFFFEEDFDTYWVCSGFLAWTVRRAAAAIVKAAKMGKNARKNIISSMSFGVTSSLASCEDLKVIDNNTCQIENFEIRGENKFAISRMIVIGFA